MIKTKISINGTAYDTAYNSQYIPIIKLPQKIKHLKRRRQSYIKWLKRIKNKQ